MNIAEIKELIDKINNSDISLFELKLDDNYLKMDKSETRTINRTEPIKENKEIIKEEINIINPVSETKVSETAKEEATTEISEDLYVVESPMVGTFYEAAGADISSFVEVGDSIKVGDTLCIIEAMKLMNEIESEVNGEIVEILIQNGEMVEYGKPLFKVRRK
ncbi:MAG: acetyl-CoA carboxylase biotin carboxyl carrier protein [Sarcina sp.]